MYYADTYRRVPMKKTAVSIVTMDGELLEGHLFITGPQRVTELLNGACQFLPFETICGSIIIFNRNLIARVIPKMTKTREDGEGDWVEGSSVNSPNGSSVAGTLPAMTLLAE